VGLNASASSFFKSGKYDLEYKKEGGTNASEWVSGEELVEVYNSLVSKDNIIAIEDAFDSEDLTNSVRHTSPFPY